MQDQITEFLGDYLGKSPEELSEALTSENAKPKEVLREWFNDKVAAVKSEAHKQGLGRGKREALSELENSISSKFGMEKKPITELIDAIVDKERSEIKINPEDVRKSKVYANDKKEWQAKLQEMQDALSAAKQQTRAVLQSQAVQSVAMPLLEEYDLGEGARKDTLLGYFKKELTREGVKWDLENGKVVAVTDADGMPIRDADHNVLKPEAFVHNVAAKFFDKKSGGGGGTRQRTTGGAFKGHNEFKHVTDNDSYMKEVQKIRSEKGDGYIDKLKKLQDHYQRQVAKE